MKLINTKIKDLFVIEPNVYFDNRGYFFESYQNDFINKEFPRINFIQDNESKSSYGTLRGLHYQLPPFAQTKLVRVIHGRVLDVALDLRKYSKTFGKHISITLDDINKRQLIIPRGFAHGFIVLSEYAIFSYKVDNLYSKKYERGILYNDPALKINWKLKNSEIKLSSKDQNLPEMKNTEFFSDAKRLYE